MSVAALHTTGLGPYVPGLEGGDPEFSVPGTGLGIPWGVDAVFQYNGLTFNDRNNVDKIRITSIEGLDDPDVRDTREDNPGSDGETIYNALYGGRTLVFGGRIEAFQRDKLRDMQQAVRTAFADLREEKPLYFLTGNRSTDHYIICRKLSKLQWTEEQKHSGTYYRDFQITVRASNPRFYLYREKNYDLGYFTTAGIGGELCTNPKFATATTGWTNSGMGVFARVTGLPANPNGTTTALHFQADVNTDNVQFSLPVTNGHLYTFAGWQTYGFYNTTPVGTVPGVQLTINNSTGVQKAASSVFAPAPWNQRLVSFTADETATWTFRLKGNSGGATTWQYDGYFTDITIYDNNAQLFALNNSLQIANLGNYTAEPAYKIFGPMSDVEFDVESDQDVETFKLKPGVSIADNDFYLIDVDNKSVVNSTGVNKFSDVATDSDFPMLQAGNNFLTIPVGKCDITGANANITVAYRDSYI